MSEQQQDLGAKEKRKRASLDAEVERVRLQVARLIKQERPVIAGPFTGEVGFELLYWIPMIRWMIEEFPALRGRLVVVSRGGVSGWLGDIDAIYVDILSLFAPEDFARHRAIADKQREVRAFDHQVIDAVKRHLVLRDAAVLHPSLLYTAYFRFLKINQLAYSRALTRQEDDSVQGLTASYLPIPPPPRAAIATELPEDYVAVRFYSRDSFPDSPDAAAFASAVINALSRTTEVVLIGTNFALDEHRDVQGSMPPGVHRIDHVMRPDNNLAVQTAVVANARAFVGTYGGFSYLAPFLGVPSLSFSTDPARTQPWHNELARGIFDGPGWGDFVALRHTDLALTEIVTRGFDTHDGHLKWPSEHLVEMSGGVRGIENNDAA